MTETRPPCAATTAQGTPCKRYAKGDSPYCGIHQRVYAPEPEPVIVEDADSEPAVDPSMQARLVEQVDFLIGRLEGITPDYVPPPFTPRGLLDMLNENADKIPSQLRLDMLKQLRQAASEDVFDIDTWKGMWFLLNYSLQSQTESVREQISRYLPQFQQLAALKKLRGLIGDEGLDMDAVRGFLFMAQYTVQMQVDMVRRRFTGEYETDEWGLDWELIETVRPFFEILYRHYWRVETTGIENIPEYGRGLIVGNHSGQLPFDGAMVGSAVMLEHPNERLVRSLYATWFPTLPFVAPFLARMGQAMATVDNGAKLLEQDELVAVYPEGYKGVSKLFKDRYKLARFGRGGFVKMAIRAGAPIIPVSIVGAEESYITLAQAKPIANMLGFPYFPITMRFPWWGLLGAIPLPTKWYIDFGEPIPMDQYDPSEADNLVLVADVTEQVRGKIQQMIDERLEQRPSVFRG